MRKILCLVLFSAMFSFSTSAQDLKYYLPDSVSYNSAIPKPKDIIFHEVGEWHVTHDRLVNYMKAIAAAAPERVKLEVTGYTYEARPQLLLIFTSPKNHQNLEQIRQQHVQLTDPSRSAALQVDNMPVIVWIGHSIHGNESSGANASLLTAYYLAAAQGKQIDDLLDNVIILFDPSFNPDGLNRFATWANQHKSKNLVTDANSREFNEVWPGGRYNHYWFDLNRDWLPAVHIESQNRLRKYHEWKPNILTDHHEQGSNATFFFQPGVPSRVNPLTPEKNIELTGKIGKFHAAFLDRIGSLYFTQENYDDFYYGKGSTYPDVNGAIGILFEQASSRGHAQQTANGILRFPFTIRNQFTTALSTLEAAKSLRKDLLNYQRDFYQSVAKEASTSAVKAYVFGNKGDQTKSAVFADMLLRHQIEIYELKNDLETAGPTQPAFEKSNAYVVPLNQPQQRLIKAIFEKTLQYKDSLFYDVTSWTMPLAFGLQYGELNATRFNNNTLGTKLSKANLQQGKLVGGKTNYAYLMDWSEFYAPRALHELQEAGITAKVATNAFEMMIEGASKKFNYGTISIPVQSQGLDAQKLYETVKAITEKNGVTTYSVSTGNVSGGSDLGSSRMVNVSRPSIAMITGQGVNALDAGEIWYLLDQQFNIRSTHLDLPVFNRVDINKYNTLIMVSGNYADINKEKLRTWVQSGGTLIVTEEAVQWASQNGLTNIVLKKVKGQDSSATIPYVEKDFRDGAQRMNGAIFRADVDLTHPLAYGYRLPYVDLFKSNSIFPEKNKNPYSNPYIYKDKPLQSGFITKPNYDAVKNSGAVLVNTLGSGRVISIADNPNFRAFWLGGTKLFMNALFFGNIIDLASARNE